MKKISRSPWNFDWLQISAVVLVVAMSAALMGLVSQDQSQAISIYDLKVPAYVQVELADSQPPQIIQAENQWLARFVISTESADSVQVNSITFSARGTLMNQILHLLTQYPLTLMHQGIEIGKGETWLYDDRFSHMVSLDQPFGLDVLHPLVVDVSTDLNNQAEETFGVTLVSIGTDSPISLYGAPVEGKLMEIQERF